MQVKDYLEQYQSVIYKTFINALKSDHLSHAYLLSGAPGMRLKDSAIYLAKSIVCDNPSPLACDSCMTCLAIDSGSYPDIAIIDGSEETIKTGDIEELMNEFEKTSHNSKGIMIYVLHLVENMTAVAVNSLLKFLEEPDNNIYAFLTTENESKILPTIMSRSQILRFKALPKNDVIQDAVRCGVGQLDAELLCSFYSDGESIKEKVASKEYQTVKDCLLSFIEALKISTDEAIYVNQSYITPKLGDNNIAKLYLKILGILFQDILNVDVYENIVLLSLINDLNELKNKLKHVDDDLYVIMSSISKLSLNVNRGLLLDHIAYEIAKEK